MAVDLLPTFLVLFDWTYGQLMEGGWRDGENQVYTWVELISCNQYEPKGRGKRKKRGRKREET